MKVGLPFHLPGRNCRSIQWCVSASEDLSGPRGDGPQTPHPLGVHVAGDTRKPVEQSVSFETAPLTQVKSQKQ